ncbi:GEVED domain-containing protein [Mangrovimonas sp. AS39]|uniref:Ig-like domain-containing protein n=1 Tax=Mangrovimonas futianensis TaxID=2895523 RepID=UPI001E4B3C4F|nr:GEVED domain-containing protein [Mangrovimonas futianensis]MCF1192543.1 GEVED domain-containing protein [Mangrovimonas futianensis]MCF1196127.1 GEVED domain-containing protein [Mangrovimonas futianensis]
MKKNYLQENCCKAFKHFIYTLLLLSGYFVQAQTTLFFEDFEAASGPENQASPYLGWQNGQFTTTPATNDNYFWVFDNTRCNVISGSYSMAVSVNNPATSGTMPQYKANKVAATLVYFTTPIDATNFESVTLDFNWICQGEANFDYGSVLYSFDGNTWAVLPGEYQGQNTTQSVTNLDLSVVDGQSFYLGYGWNNDNSTGNYPAFTIDDIEVKGTPLPACATPSQQPTTLTLSATGDSAYGSFTAASPEPDNYLVVISTSATPPTPIDGVNYNIGDTIGTATVVDIDSSTNFTATGLTQNTTYYVYVFSFNSDCTGGPLYFTTNPLSGNVTTTNSSYCTPTTTAPENEDHYIEDVEFISSLNYTSNSSTFSNTTPGYQDFTSTTPCIQAQGEGINVSVGTSTGRGRWKAWVDWNKDGVFANDNSEIVYDSGGVVTASTSFGFTIPNNQGIGNYRIRIRHHRAEQNNGNELLGAYNYTPCQSFSSGMGQNHFGEAEDYLFTVIENCSAQITSITDGTTCGEGNVDLTVTGSSDTTQFKWYDAETGGNLLATTNSGTWSPFISATTSYWVTASNGICESVRRLEIIGTVNPVTTLSFVPETPEICGENDIIEISATGDTEIAYLIDEDFESGFGTFSQNNIITNGSPADDISTWQVQASTYIPNGYVWYPAISSGFGTNSFVISVADSGDYTENELVSDALDSSTFTNLTLELDMYFSRYNLSVPEEVNLEISTDGGNTWPNIVANITDDVGYGTQFSHLTYDLSSYINEPNLRFRIYYYSEWGDGLAIDNIELYGSRPLTPSFTWSGTPAVDAYTDAAATIPYVPGTSIGTVYVKPTITQLELEDFTFTAIATLNNGCDISKDVIISNKTKVWKGTDNSNWNEANNWAPYGVPDETNCVIIQDSESNIPYLSTPIPPVLNTAYAKNLTIKDSGNLNVLADNNLVVMDWIAIEDNTDSSVLELDVRNGANLVQINNATNSGEIHLKRIADVDDATDYVYWSAPVANFSSGNLPTGGLIWKWIPSVNNGGTYTSNFGNWINGNETMTIGMGYISNSPTNTSFTTEFIGTPNNGDISVPISRGTYTGADYTTGPTITPVTKDDDNWNLLGNPYPSAISADKFLANNSTHLEPFIYLWTHGINPSTATDDPFYGDYASNYDSADYLTYNATGGTQFGFEGFIAAGQGFFTLMTDNGSTSEIANFDNSMRYEYDSVSYETYDNSQFYKTNSNSTASITFDEKHRIWLSLSSPGLPTSNILVGYVSNAINGYDPIYDAPAQGVKIEFELYSLVEDKSLAIQGKSLPFDELDTIPLGLKLPQNGNYTISINHVDGLFEDATQNIYLEDTYTGIISDLRMAPFSFNNDEGIYNDRFILRYTNETLSLPESMLENTISIKAPNGSYILVNSSQGPIEEIHILDLTGKRLIQENALSSSQVKLESLNLSTGSYLVSVTLKNGFKKTQKVILK